MVEFASPVGLSGRGEVSTVIHGGDENLYVEFYKNPTFRPMAPSRPLRLTSQ